jgi:hypothetical protein
MGLPLETLALRSIGNKKHQKQGRKKGDETQN